MYCKEYELNDLVNHQGQILLITKKGKLNHHLISFLAFLGDLSHAGPNSLQVITYIYLNSLNKL